MYEGYFGLSGKPFSLLPDSDFLYLGKQHRRAVNLLEYGMVAQAGFIVISGEVGTGKTTIIRRFLKTAGPDLAVGLITNSSQSLGTLIGWVINAFQLDRGTGETPALYERFIEFLVARYAEGKRTVLIIDEAQNLDVAALEELRMLSNVNNEKDLLLQIVLLGQPELLETLKRPELRQFVQRISVHYHLSALTPDETAAYIRHRLATVGGYGDIFDKQACAAVHYFTNGTPRLINLLCDIALVYAFSEDARTVDLDIIADVVRERSQNGLSPFRALPEPPTIDHLASELAPLIDEIGDPLPPPEKPAATMTGAAAPPAASRAPEETASSPETGGHFEASPSGDQMLEPTIARRRGWLWLSFILLVIAGGTAWVYVYRPELLNRWPDALAALKALPWPNLGLSPSR